MSETQFKKGDVVKLKSGGPEMTVFSPDGGYGQVSCQWWNSEKNEFCFDRFQPESLQKCGSESPSSG